MSADNSGNDGGGDGDGEDEFQPTLIPPAVSELGPIPPPPPPPKPAADAEVTAGLDGIAIGVETERVKSGEAGTDEPAPLPPVLVPAVVGCGWVSGFTDGDRTAAAVAADIV